MAVAVTDRLVSMVNEVTPVNERIMRLKISHTLKVISLVFAWLVSMNRLGYMNFPRRTFRKGVLRPAPDGGVLVFQVG